MMKLRCKRHHKTMWRRRLPVIWFIRSNDRSDINIRVDKVRHAALGELVRFDVVQMSWPMIDWDIIQSCQSPQWHLSPSDKNQKTRDVLIETGWSGFEKWKLTAVVVAHVNVVHDPVRHRSGHQVSGWCCMMLTLKPTELAVHILCVAAMPGPPAKRLSLWQ